MLQSSLSITSYDRKRTFLSITSESHAFGLEWNQMSAWVSYKWWNFNVSLTETFAASDDIWVIKLIVGS